MFNAGLPEIQYVGKLFVRLGAIGVAKTEVYPISSLNLVNKDSILKLFKEEDALIRKEKPEMRNYGLGQGWEKEGPLYFERGFYEYQKKVGFISFEVYEETKLREKREFLVPTV